MACGTRALDVGVQRGVGVRSFAWRCQLEEIAAYVGWIDRPKTMPFLRSAAEPLASLEEKNVGVPSWFHSVFQIFAQPKQGESFRPTDIPRGVFNPASVVWGRFVMASVDSTGEL